MKKRVLMAIIAVLSLTVTALAAFVWPGFLSAPRSGNDAAARSDPNGELRVYFINVGQGDSTLITDGTHTVLIDAGDGEHGSKVYSRLHTEVPEDHIDILIITHDHIDHVGGLSKILKDCRADVIIAPSFDGVNLTSLSDLLKGQQEKGTELRVLQTNETVVLGDIRLDMHRMGKDAQSENDSSIITRVQYGDTVFLIMADAGIEAETDWMLHSGLSDLSCQVLRVGHHGSDTSSSRRFLEAVSPKYAVISVAKANQYGLPDDSVVSRLAAMGCNPWKTEVGTVVVETDGVTVSVSSILESADVSTAPFIGNSNSKKVHRRDCSSVSTISEEHLVAFDSLEVAFQEGYKPCGKCYPGQ